MSLGTQLLVLVVVHTVLLALPFVAGMILASPRSGPGLAWQIAVGLVVSGSAAYATFWLYFVSPVVGRVASWLVIAVSIAVIAWWGRRRMRVVRVGVVLLSAVAAAATFVLSLAYAHGGLATPVASSTVRFSHPLPGDNQISRYFGEWYYAHGHEAAPPFGDWLSSDRPPLQVGYYLQHRPFFVGSAELNYEVVGALLQSMWVIGVVALLAAMGIRRLAATLILVALAVSDVVLVHTVFIWPKLLPAAFLVAAVALLVSPTWTQVRARRPGAVVVAGLAGLAMLGHGSTLFPMIGIALLMAFRGLPSVRWLASATACGAILLGTWSAYQHWADPPGNRLLKWQLAGQIAITEEGTGSTIVHAYERAGWDGAVDNKLANVRTTLWSPELLTALKGGRPWQDVVAARRLDAFYSLIPSLGLLLLGPIVALVRIRRLDARLAALARATLTCAALAAIVSCALLFGAPESTAMIHVTSLATPLLALVGCTAALLAASSRWGAVWIAAYLLIQLAVYAPVLTPEPHTEWSRAAVGVSLLALVGLVGLCYGVAGGWNTPLGAPSNTVKEGRHAQA